MLEVIRIVLFLGGIGLLVCCAWWGTSEVWIYRKNIRQRKKTLEELMLDEDDPLTGEALEALIDLELAKKILILLHKFDEPGVVLTMIRKNRVLNIVRDLVNEQW